LGNPLIGSQHRIRHGGTAETRIILDQLSRRDRYYPCDLGRIDEEGYLYVVGRAKDMIIRGGINIYPADIEETLIRQPNVHAAAVVGWPSREFGEEVAAFVVADGSVASEELRDLCRESLARYKVPREVFVVEEFPKNAMGKVLKQELVKRLPAIGR